ncbi:bifunctional methionine sulfoxide reductase B/A protein [Flavobacterium sp. DG1-102-2]|uniref:bifunctional methionine sulfoxide reductase B/A protein n=1 Tax=Flavobacterium sp. DG1-102-2 TaxID=3081663 RepID=UPI00294A3326|nr:bifunctional methionine sulfoxide reductase B/A protein [Flavobacterium sp. DG1-102-2]MDV6170345.1 bifunctional methionine sulfoxide reductase B/A protein [Flavobacterium sp. DG1-102-2]
MLKWIDIVKFASTGNPKPDHRVEKTEKEWKALLSDEEFRITRLKGTERAHSSEMCSLFEPGIYSCVCCGTLLFDGGEKFESGTGWPSFTQPIKENAVAYHKDVSYGMVRIEALCNTCDAHLGHVFQDGPPPSGLRYCMNAVALKKVTTNDKKATFGGGCFWCTEAVFTLLKGVSKVESGYTDGKIDNPTYREVCSGLTGHAEVIEVTYNPDEISYEDLLRIHLSTHNPTTLNRQGADVGTQYRSIILYRNEQEKMAAQNVVEELQEAYAEPIVTELKPFSHFYKAEEYHQDYYKNNSQEGYCQAVIDPKLKKFRQLFKEKLRDETDTEVNK